MNERDGWKKAPIHSLHMDYLISCLNIKAMNLILRMPSWPAANEKSLTFFRLFSFTSQWIQEDSPVTIFNIS